MNTHAAAKSPRTPAYQEVAEVLRKRIQDGTYKVGEKLPSQVVLAEEHYFSLETIRRALNILSAEGLITNQRGSRGAQVNPQTRTIVIVPTGASIVARVLTSEEKLAKGLSYLTMLVLVVSIEGQPDAVYPAHTTVLKCESS